MGGREAEMTFGIGEFDYSELYGDARTVVADLPNAGTQVNLTFLPSDAVLGPVLDFTADITTGGDTLQRGKTYVVTNAQAGSDFDDVIAAQSDLANEAAFAVSADSAEPPSSIASIIS